MIPLIDKKQTGINLRRIMDECGSVDDMLCGSRKRILTAENQVQLKRMRIYYGKIKAIEAA